LAFSYWIDNLGFITEEKLAAIFIKPSLGVLNWPVIYFINYTPTSSLAPFITTPSKAISGAAPATPEGYHSDCSWSAAPPPGRLFAWSAAPPPSGKLSASRCSPLLACCKISGCFSGWRL
jgi:hypothetical protein